MEYPKERCWIERRKNTRRNVGLLFLVPIWRDLMSLLRSAGDPPAQQTAAHPEEPCWIWRRQNTHSDGEMFPPNRFELFKLLLDIRLGIYWVIPKEPLLSQYSDQTKTSQIWVMRSVSHMPTRSLSHPALGLQRLFKVIGSNIEQQIIAHQRSCDAADDAKILTRKKAYFPSINLTSRHCHLFDLPIQQSNAFLSPYPIPQNIFF